MHVDETRRDDRAGAIDDLGFGGVDTSARAGHLAVREQEIAHAVEALRGIEQPAAAQDDGAHQ